MIPLIWIRGMILAALISSISGLGYLGYSKIKSIGYQEAADKYELVIKDYNERVLNKIDAIEQNSSTLIVESRTNTELLSKNVTGIVKWLKGKTLTIVKNGECTPSKTFSNSFNQINRTVNENMKGSQK